MDKPAVKYRFANFTLSTSDGCLWRDGQLVNLRPKEFDLLLCLVEKAPNVVPKDEVFQRVWKAAFVTDSVLSSTLSTLRTSLETDGTVYIETVPKKGLRFVGLVEAVEDGKPIKPASRLPRQLSRFVGRHKEMAEIEKLISGSPLVTLIGEGGIGKTRLAIETAAGLEARYSGAVWFASLAEIMDADLIMPVIAFALGLRSLSPDKLKEETANKLSQQRSLLVLDNFEHIVDIGANTLKQLLERSAGLTCLVTSRRQLNIDGERVFPLPPLVIPDQGMNIEQLREVESVLLFVDRARSVNPSFDISSENAGQIKTICERLEGIPLAIEIAASRARGLSPAQILKGLERRFKFLVSNRRDAVDRHRTLYAAIDWSYRLLPLELQRVFASLSIFRGGCTMEAVEDVCGEAEALETLTSLEEWSLVRAEFVGNHTRYKMSEVFREFGSEQLSDEERASIAQSHADYFFNLAEKASQKLIGAEQTAWLDRLEIEHDNLRAALDYYRNKQSTASRELELTVFLSRFWTIRGYWSEGRERLQQAIVRQQPGDSSIKAQGLAWLGWLALRQDDYESAGQSLSESLAMSQDVDDKESHAFSLYSLSWLAEAQGRYQDAKSFFTESLKWSQEANSDWLIGEAFRGLGRVAETEGDLASAREFYLKYLSMNEKIQHTAGIAGALDILGVIAREQANYSEARRFHQKSLALRLGIGNKLGTAFCYFNLGLLEEAVGQYQDATDFFKKDLALRQELGDRGGAAKALEGLGRTLAATGREADAACLFGAADALRLSIAAPLSPAESKSYGQLISSVKEKFSSSWEDGERWQLDEAITFALSVGVGA